MSFCLKLTRFSDDGLTQLYSTVFGPPWPKDIEAECAKAAATPARVECFSEGCYAIVEPFNMMKNRPTYGPGLKPMPLKRIYVEWTITFE